MSRKPVTLIVGPGTASESFPQRYYSSADEILTYCRNRVGELYTTNPLIVVAYQELHRLGEVELTVHRVQDGVVTVYDLDERGDFINPWPDEFFGLDFNLRFR